MAFCSSWLWSSSLPAITPKCRASTPRIDSGAATARLVANGSVTVATPTAVRKWRRSRDIGGLASFVRALSGPSCAPDRLCRDGTAVFRLTCLACRFHGAMGVHPIGSSVETQTYRMHAHRWPYWHDLRGGRTEPEDLVGGDTQSGPGSDLASQAGRRRSCWPASAARER